MIIQNKDNKITIVSMADKLLPIHETLGYELMAQPDFEVQGQKLHLVDGILAIDTELTNELAFKALISGGEAQVTQHIQEAITTYNVTNGINFKDINAIPKYLYDDTYAHFDFCVAIIAFNKACWEASRQIQADIVSGDIEIPTADEFKAMLPVFGE